MEKKFDLSEKVRKELEKEMDEVKKVLEDRDKEIQDLKDQLCQAKEVAIHEYRDFDACCPSWETLFWRVLMTLSIKSRRPTLTWTCPTSKLKTKAKPPSCPSPRRTLRTFLLKMQLKAMESLPRRKMLKVKSNL